MRGAGTDVSGFFKSSEGPFDGPEKDHGSAGCLTVDSPRTVIDTPVAQMEGSDEEHRAGKATSAIGWQFSDEKTMAAAEGAIAETCMEPVSPSRCLRGDSSYLLGDADETFSAGGLEKEVSGSERVDADDEIRRVVGHGFPSVFPLIRSLLIEFGSFRSSRHGETKSTGDVFPLPTGTDRLKGIGTLSDEGVVCLSCICIGLNSYAGCQVEVDKPVSQLQRQFLEGLSSIVKDMGDWTERFTEISWSTFFKFRSVDYVGDEVAVARITSWNNIKSAIPVEVGTVRLQDVVGAGCRHYVERFEDFLLDEGSMVYTRPPRVMITDADWEQMCEGLIGAGLCDVMAESDLYHVKGKPLLNGLFGVSKGEQVDGHDVHRLIMNLIPLNNVCRGIQGDIATLPAWSSSGPLSLMPTENLLVSSEDVKCFFYIFKVPKGWHRFLGFNKTISPRFHPGRDGRHVLVAKVLPMGFKNSVSIAQHIHRTIVRWAGTRAGDRLQPHQELRKDKPFPSSDVIHRIYLDNFDEMERVDTNLAQVSQGSASPAILALRREYEYWGIPRHPRKAVERSFKAEVQGAIVDGTVGCAYPKPEKILKYTQLALMAVVAGKCNQKEMQVVAGGLVYVATFRRALMGSLNAIWSFIEEFNKYPMVVRLEIPRVVKLEIARFLALVPLARMDFRSQPSSLVTASDASTSGGGVTVSRGLSNLGQMAASCKVRGDVPALDDMTQVLTIGLFDGIGALRVAADAAGIPVAGHISVEINPEASRVLESKFPGTIFVTNVEDVDAEMVKQWSCQFTQVGLVVLGAGPPCQGVSGLNVDRRGALRDQRSKLHVHVARIRDLVKRAFPWAQVHALMESVQSMDVEDRQIMSASFGETPWAIDAEGVSLARRPRLYWVTWGLQECEGVRIQAPSEGDNSPGTVELSGKVVASKYLTSGWTRTSEEPLPTFTTSRPRDFPGRRPAGIDKLSEAERQQWVDDAYRFPPYQYQHCFQVQRGEDHRLVNVEEREVILGFPRQYTLHCLVKAKQNTTHHTDVRLTLLGNTWNVTVVTWLLGQLCQTLGIVDSLSVQQCIDRTAPGSSADLATFLTRPPMSGPRKQLTQGKELHLVKKLLNMVSIKGEDILISSATEETLRYHRLRASVPSNLWVWRTVCGWTWKGSREHINNLEMRAVLCALKWRIIKQKTQRQRLVHLTDSLVCLHTLTRGRTSSRKLRRTVACINSLLLLSQNSAVWTYVHTALNPADAPSRGRLRRKW